MGFVLARVLAAFMLLAAPGRLPYDFYTLMRWLVSGVCVYGAYREGHAARRAQLWFYVVLAVLFNPLAPVRLQRATWEPIDFLAGVALVGSALVDWRGRQP